jgi:hypothetical protein
MANIFMKKWPTSLAIKELQIKTTLIHSFQSAWLSIISNKQQKMLANVPGKKNPSHCLLEYKLVQLLWKAVWKFLKI